MTQALDTFVCVGLIKPALIKHHSGSINRINDWCSLNNKCWFDKTNAHEGIQCLRHYRYDVDPDTKQFSQKPLHDNYSHGADAFRYIGLMVNEPRKAPKQRATYQLPSSWMG